MGELPPPPHSVSTVASDFDFSRHKCQGTMEKNKLWELYEEIRGWLAVAISKNEWTENVLLHYKICEDREKPVNQIRIAWRKWEEQGWGRITDMLKGHGSCLGSGGEAETGVSITPRFLTWEVQETWHGEPRHRWMVGSGVGEGKYNHGEVLSCGVCKITRHKGTQATGNQVGHNR